MIDEPGKDSYSKIIDLVFEDAQRSIESLDESSNILNTKLSAVAGFGIVLVKFVGDLPGQILNMTNTELNSPLICYSCSLLKILSLLLLIASTLIALRALLPKKGDDRIISPAEQVEKCLELSKDEYKLLFIQQYDRDIESLAELRDWKAQRLNWAGEALVASAILSALDILLVTYLNSFV